MRNATALEALTELEENVDSIVMLDVIEHMEKTVGKTVLKLAEEKAKSQVVIYTPFGFKPQEGDAWGLNGHEWQRHRSGWTPDEFPDWRVVSDRSSFFAILDK